MGLFGNSKKKEDVKVDSISTLGSDESVASDSSNQTNQKSGLKQPIISNPTEVTESLAKKPVKEEEIVNLHSGAGLNLIVIQSSDEIKVEKRKSSFNIVSALFIIFTVGISIAIIGFNIYTKNSYQGESDQLIALEKDISLLSSTIKVNDQIIERIDLYEQIELSSVSPKDLLLYWRELTGDYGEVLYIKVNNGVDFEFSGRSESLYEVSLLWHRLSIDPRIQEITLESLGTSAEGASYSFDGLLSESYFTSID